MDHDEDVLLDDDIELNDIDGLDDFDEFGDPVGKKKDDDPLFADLEIPDEEY